MVADGDAAGLRAALATFDVPKSGGAAVAVLACRDGNRRTALHFAANQGHISCINELLSVAADKKSVVDAADADGATPLMMAILGDSDGALECIDALLAAGADVNLRRKVQLDTALHIAARNGHLEAARKLIAAGADLSAHSVVGTPLHEAAAEGETAIIDLLVSAVQAQHDRPAGVAGTSTQAIAPPTSSKAAKLWLGAKGPRGVTPLLLAAASRHEEAAARLTAVGSPLSVATEGGLTALHLMAESGHVAAVAEAVRRAARPPAGAAAASASGSSTEGDHEDDASHAMSLRNADGLIPIQLAAAGGHRAVVEHMWPHSSPHLSGDGPATPAALLEAEQAKRAAEVVGDSAAAASAKVEAAGSSSLTDALEAEADDFVRPAGETTEGDVLAALGKKAEGNEAFKAAKLVEAEELYTEAIDLDPRSAVLRLNRSAARLRRKNAMGALTDAVIARKLDGTLAKACYREGMARMALGQFEEAAVALFEGTKLDTASKEIESKFKEAVAKGKTAHRAKVSRADEEARMLRRKAEAEEVRFRTALKQLKAKQAGSRS